MTDDELIARACGVPRERFACGCPRPFSMGFGYRDPQAICYDCERKREHRLFAVLAILAIAGAIALRWWQ